MGFLAAGRGFARRIRHSAHLVIGVLADYRGRGIGTELFKALDGWAKKENILRLELTVMTHNDAAVALYKKMGFKKEGLKERSLIINGEYVDEYYMAKLLNR